MGKLVSFDPERRRSTTTLPVDWRIRLLCAINLHVWSPWEETGRTDIRGWSLHRQYVQQRAYEHCGVVRTRWHS